MTKESQQQLYIDTVKSLDNGVDDNRRCFPNLAQVSPSSETSDSGIDTLPKNASLAFSADSSFRTPERALAEVEAGTMVTGFKNENDGTPIHDSSVAEEDSDTSTWVSRNVRNRRLRAESDSQGSSSGSFLEQSEPVAIEKSSQVVVAEINSLGKEDAKEQQPCNVVPFRPQRPSRTSLERSGHKSKELASPTRSFSQEASQSNPDCESVRERPLPRLRIHSRESSEDTDEEIIEFVARTRKSSGILKNSPNEEAFERQCSPPITPRKHSLEVPSFKENLEAQHSPAVKPRKYSREVLGGTPVETIHEDDSQTSAKGSSSYGKFSRQQLSSPEGDPEADNVFNLTVSDEEFQENYLGNIPANKRKFGVFPPQYRSPHSSEVSPTDVNPPSTTARHYRRSTSESGSKRISFDFTNQGFSNDSSDNIPMHTKDEDIEESSDYDDLPQANDLHPSHSVPDLRMFERYKRARRFSHTSLDTLSRASSTGSDISLSKCVAEHVRRDSIALFSDKLNGNTLKRASQKLVMDLEQLGNSNVGIIWAYN